MNQIIVLNRKKAIKFTYQLNEQNEDKKYAIISIRGLYDKKPFFAQNKQIVDICYLVFDDISVEKDENGSIGMQESDAKIVKNFINQVQDKIDCLIVHCEAGQSRSAGVAAAIAKAKFNDDEFYFKNYRPNFRCYKLVLNEFFK